MGTSCPRDCFTIQHPIHTSFIDSCNRLFEASSIQCRSHAWVQVNWLLHGNHQVTIRCGGWGAWKALDSKIMYACAGHQKRYNRRFIIIVSLQIHCRSNTNRVGEFQVQHRVKIFRGTLCPGLNVFIWLICILPDYDGLRKCRDVE